MSLDNNSSNTSGPGRDSEGNVTFREEQQNGGGHGTKCKPIGPTITEAAHGVHRPGTQQRQNNKRIVMATVSSHGSLFEANLCLSR